MNLNRYTERGIQGIRGVWSISGPLFLILLAVGLTIYMVVDGRFAEAKNWFIQRAHAQVAPTPVYTIYGETIAWSNWSWGTRWNASATSPVYAGSNSLAVTYTEPWGGLSFRTSRAAGFDTTPFTHLRFAVHTNGRPMPLLEAGLYDQAGKVTRGVHIGPYTSPQGNGWHLVSIPLSAMNASKTSISRVFISEAAGVVPPTFYIDDLQFVVAKVPPEDETTVPIYDEALYWRNWSWSTEIDSHVADPVYEGQWALGVKFGAPFAGLAFRTDGVDTSSYTHLEVAVHERDGALPILHIALQGADGSTFRNASLSARLVPAENGWQTASIPLDELDAQNVTITGVTIQESGGVAPTSLYVDNLRLVRLERPEGLPARELPIEVGDAWSYRLGTSEPPVDWTEVDFDDAFWTTGPSSFGYGYDGIATELIGMEGRYNSLYLRKPFVVDEPQMVSRLVLSIDFDDAFVAYLNGKEVARSNVTGNPPAYNGLADAPRGALNDDANPQPTALIDLSEHIGLLRQGTNVFAIHGLNVNRSSSDFLLAPALEVSIAPPPPPLPIALGDDWRYLKGTQPPPENWNKTGFNASEWESGPSGFGYGDGDHATALDDMRHEYLSVFMRREFTVDDSDLVVRALLSIDYDDGFIAYLNGVEVARAGMFDGPVAYTTPAKGYHEASGMDVKVYDVTGNLRKGPNVLAIQGHNHWLSSPSFALRPELTAYVVRPDQARFHILPGDRWHYARGTQEPPSGWKEIDFDYSSWSSGPSGFGYGDGDDATVLRDMEGKYLSVYIRKTFEVADPEAVDMMFLNVDFDDAFVAYINGVEVARDNVKGSAPAFDAKAARPREASRGDPGAAEPVQSYDLSGLTDLLVAGTNVVAIQGHNIGLESSDFSLIPSLLGTGELPVDPVLLRHPYLQAPAQDAVTVVWATKGAGAPSVEYGAGAAMSTATGTAAYYSRMGGYYQHEVRLEGLEPGQTYTYAILLDGEAVETPKPLSFKSAPPPGAPLTIGAFGDSGTGMPKQLQVRDRLEMDQFDLLLHTGDLAEAGATFANYQRFHFDVYRDLLARVPFVAAQGNGDYWYDRDQELGEAFREMLVLPVDAPSETSYFSFDYGDVHILGVDTENMNQAQREWVDADLAATDKPWKIVFFHRAAFDDGGYHSIMEHTAAGVRSGYVRLFEKYGVNLVLSGHNATYGRTQPLVNGQKEAPYAEITTTEAGGVVYVTTGGGGDFDLLPLKPDAFHAPPGATMAMYHYTKVQIDGCKLTIEAIDEMGEVRDTFTIDKCA